MLSETKFKRAKERKLKKSWIIYQENNSTKACWDNFQSLILIYSCFITPLILCFNFDSATMEASNIIIDLLFLTDMIVIFNTAITNDDFETIDDHKSIAFAYLTGWFWIDLVAILPFEYMVPGN